MGCGHSTGTAYGTAAGDPANVGTDTFTGVNAIRARTMPIRLRQQQGSSTTQSFDGGAGDDTIDGRGGFDQAYYNSAIGTVSGINVTVATNNVVGDAFQVVGDASIGTDTLMKSIIRGTNFAELLMRLAITAPRLISRMDRRSTSSRGSAATTSLPAMT